MLIGYARVSTPDQKLDPQRDELKRAGCRKVFTDIVSGANTDRPGRAEALAYARKGDTIVVPRLDRFGRSLVDLVQTVHELRDRHVGFRSLHESIDTTTSGGRLIFHVFSALAEFERDLIRERTMAGLSAARARRGATEATNHRDGRDAGDRDVGDIAPLAGRTRPRNPPRSSSSTGSTSATPTEPAAQVELDQELEDLTPGRCQGQTSATSSVAVESAATVVPLATNDSCGSLARHLWSD